MAQPAVLQESFTRMIQDVPRDELPPDAAWEIMDFIPNLGLTPSGSGQGGRLAKRGGWMYASEDVSTDSTSSTGITALGYFESVSRLCLMTNNNKFGYIDLPGGSTNNYTQVSTSGVQSNQPFVEFFGKLIIPANDGTTAPKYYDGTTFGNLAGSPPAGVYCAPWSQRLLLGGTAANPRRTYFSAVGDPTTWDTTNSWIDSVEDVTGYALLPTSMLIFGPSQTSRLRGAITTLGGDLIHDDPIFQTGCIYPESIAVNGPNCVFANQQGVFLTNGTSLPQDITQICGIKHYWQYSVADRYIGPASGSVGIGGGWTVDNVLGGFIGHYYLVVIQTTALEGGSSPHIGFLFNLAEQSCSLLGNFDMDSIAMTPQVGDELFFGNGTRVVQTSPIFEPTATNKADGDGTAILPQLGTRYYSDSKSFQKRWKTAYLDYGLQDASADNPQLSVYFNPEWDGTAGQVSVGTLTETGTNTTRRAKMPVAKLARGGSFTISQQNNSASTVLHALLADVHAREGGRV